jgi:hypothetical protein
MSVKFDPTEDVEFNLLAMMMRSCVLNFTSQSKNSWALPSQTTF